MQFYCMELLIRLHPPAVTISNKHPSKMLVLRSWVSELVLYTDSILLWEYDAKQIQQKCHEDGWNTWFIPDHFPVMLGENAQFFLLSDSFTAPGCECWSLFGSRRNPGGKTKEKETEEKWTKKIFPCCHSDGESAQETWLSRCLHNACCSWW